ncbi:MliC family protein [Xanthobacter sp. TB0139]|uniref:MliC family protein n=1 Tax=Xanthobacter sp. TB0139 TaxID=3459178 RepID=UPI00403A17CA
MATHRTLISAMGTLAIATAAMISPSLTSPGLAASTEPALRARTTLTLGPGPVETNPVRYECDKGWPLSVTYVNAGPNVLAIIRVKGVAQLFVSAISASGSRYVSGPYEWWAKGDEGILRDLTRDEDENVLYSCKTVTDKK